jgi:hypothetical protein
MAGRRSLLAAQHRPAVAEIVVDLAAGDVEAREERLDLGALVVVRHVGNQLIVHDELYVDVGKTRELLEVRGLPERQLQEQKEGKGEQVGEQVEPAWRDAAQEWVQELEDPYEESIALMAVEPDDELPART